LWKAPNSKLLGTKTVLQMGGFAPINDIFIW